MNDKLDKNELKTLVCLMISEVEMLKKHDKLLADNRVNDIIEVVSRVAIQDYKDSITEY